MERFFMERLKYIVEDSTIAELLGVQNFTNKESAILELVKNAYDAQASTVSITFSNHSIVIVDDGIGMSKSTIYENWIKANYAGGVSELTPNEFRTISVPYRQIKPCDIERVKTMFSNNVNLNQIVAFVNSKTLESDLTTEEISRLNTIRVKLIGRRK